MSFSAGARLGPYEVLSAIGRGGMGEVYRARDTKLDRDVALKVLPEAFAADPDRLARFEREARLLASVNHPNIAGIYGLEGSRGARVLVLELVEGRTLAEASAGSAGLPAHEVLSIAHQIAEALEAAHERGIIHRDLKPANIKITPDGHVKVLDFGLAKALESTASADASASPTITSLPMRTEAGAILGTAAYMSPEQARGDVVDRRADIWAFGCVLYEMLTGLQAFGASDVSSTIARVLERQPDYGALPPGVSPRLRELLERCLEKDAKRRWRDIGDVRLDIERLLAAPADAVESPALAAASARVRWWVFGTAVATAAIVGAAAWYWTPAAAPPSRGRFVVSAPPSPVPTMAGDESVAISPDGRRIAYAADIGGADGLYLREIDQVEGRFLPGTNLSRPFFSPDSARIGFYSFADRALMTASVLGGANQVLASMDLLRGATWGSDGFIIVSTTDPSTGLLRLPEEGGDLVPLTTPEPGTDHVTPHLLPGGRAVLFTIASLAPDVDPRIAVLDLNTGQYKELIPGSSPRLAPTGHLVYGAPSGLSAVEFDTDRLEVRGDPVRLPDDVGFGSATAESFYDLSRDGSFVFLAGAVVGGQRLVWVTRNGDEEPIDAEARGYLYPRISPDGRRVAVSVRDRSGDDILIWDDAQRTLTRFTRTQDRETYPVWTPDGERIAFLAMGLRTGLFWKAANETSAAGVLAEAPELRAPYFFSPSGSELVYAQQSPPGLGWVSVDGDFGPEWLVQTGFAISNAALSPDGRWMAYQSDESGRYEIYVRPFPDVEDERQTASGSGGIMPVWSRDGTELFYLEPGSPTRLMSVEVDTGSRLTVEGRRALMDWPYAAGPAGRRYDVALDGRFVAIAADDGSTGGGAPPRVEIILNWVDELTRLARRR